MRLPYEIAFPECEHQKLNMLLVFSIYWKRQWKKVTQLGLEIFETPPATEETNKMKKLWLAQKFVE